MWSKATPTHISDAMQRVGVQRAVLWDAPGALEGKDYEAAFEAGLIEGSWRWSQNFKRKFRNGNIPTDVWPQIRAALIRTRRASNMTQDWNLIGARFGESPRQIRQAGREAVLNMMKQGEGDVIALHQMKQKEQKDA